VLVTLTTLAATSDGQKKPLTQVEERLFVLLILF
jgi:hypothetical protein